MTDDLLVEQTEYLEAGIHIGTKVRTPGMKKYIYKVREDGLYLLDIPVINKRIKLAAKMLAKYEPSDIVVTASRIYSITAASKFAEITKTKIIAGRVMPGLFTNPNREDFIEPEVVLISDNRNERQAIKEASKTNVPIIALCDTDNWIKFVDLVIPCHKVHGSLSFFNFDITQLLRLYLDFCFKVRDLVIKFIISLY